MKISLYLFFFTIMFSIVGCHDADILVENCIIKYFSAPDNCNEYMIVFEQDDPVYDKIFKPDKLPDQFKVNELQVKLSYRITEEKYSCGFGGYVPVIHIIKIQKK